MYLVFKIHKIQWQNIDFTALFSVIIFSNPLFLLNFTYILFYIIIMITNYNYQYPSFIAYFVLPQTQLPVMSYQQSWHTPITNVDTFLKNQTAQIYYKPQQSQVFIEQFISNKPNFNKNKADIAYLQLGDKLFIKEVPNLQNFREIYNRGIERYKSSYKLNQRKLSWGRDDIIILLWILDKYCNIYDKIPKIFQQEDWEFIARLIPFRTADDCMFKYFEMQRIPLSKKPWTKEQDLYLCTIVDELDESFTWATVSQKLYKKSSINFRTAKQCRQHYNLLKTAQFNRAKKLWTAQEDLQLLKLYQKQGRKWKTISKLLIGRSENAIKNRFTLLMCRYGKNHSYDLKDPSIISLIRQKITQQQKNKLDQKQNLIKRLELIEKEDLELESEEQVSQ